MQSMQLHYKPANNCFSVDLSYTVRQAIHGLDF